MEVHFCIYINKIVINKLKKWSNLNYIKSLELYSACYNNYEFNYKNSKYHENIL